MESWQRLVPLRYKNLGSGHAPGDVERGIREVNASVMLGGIIVRDLVGKDGVLGAGNEAVGETRGDEELGPFLRRELDRKMLSKAGGRPTKINHDIEHRSLQHTGQFGLSARMGLIMQATQCADACAGRDVVLHEGGLDPPFGKSPLIVGLNKKSAGIRVSLRLDDVDARQRRSKNIQFSVPISRDQAGQRTWSSILLRNNV